MTLRELLWMADGRGRSAWSHTAQILAMIANANRNPKKKPSPFKPEEFFPYKAEESKPIQKTNDLSILKSVFVDKNR